MNFKMIGRSLLAAAMCACAMAKPPLKFDSSNIAVNTKPDELRITVRYPFVNDSGGVVEIKDVVMGCTCTHASFVDDKRVYQPQQKGALDVTMDLGTFTGSVTKHVTLIPKEGEPMVLNLTCNIPEVVEVRPKTLKWTVDGDATPQTIDIFMRSPEPIKLKEVSATTRDFDFDIKTVEKGRHYQVIVRPLSLKGRAHGNLFFHTDSPIKRYAQAFATVHIGAKK